jgi:hypothetical protein
MSNAPQEYLVILYIIARYSIPLRSASGIQFSVDLASVDNSHPARWFAHSVRDLDRGEHRIDVVNILAGSASPFALSLFRYV